MLEKSVRPPSILGAAFASGRTCVSGRKGVNGPKHAKYAEYRGEIEINGLLMTVPFVPDHSSGRLSSSRGTHR